MNTDHTVERGDDGAPSTDPASTVRRSKQVRTIPDWHAIEQDYRTGEWSLHQLSVLHRCSRSTIVNKATRDGWTRERRDGAGFPLRALERGLPAPPLSWLRAITS